MVAALLPTGMFAGEFYTATSSEDPEFYEVRLGRELFRLDATTYAVWALAHGEPELLVGGGEANRLALATAGRAAGLGDVTSQINDLTNLELLVQVLPIGNQLQRFAQDFRLRPLALGLGNIAADRERLRIGHPDTFRVAVPPLAYNVWLHSDGYESLWETCTVMAASLRSQDDSATAVTVLNELFAVLPTMLAVSCAYLDVRR